MGQECLKFQGTIHSMGGARGKSCQWPKVMEGLIFKYFSGFLTLNFQGQ